MKNMSYLDKPLTRESYFEHISTKSNSQRVNSKIALNWFDKFCVGRFIGKEVETILIDLMKQKYEEPQRHTKNLFDILQDFINYLGLEGQDPSTMRGNFNLVKNYLNWYGFEIYNESVKSRLNFPKKIEEESYPLTIDDVKTLLHHANAQRRALILFLSSTGMRIQETLKLRKRDLDFSLARIMVRIPGKYTKTGTPRKTFLSKETETYLKPILEKINDDALIFGTNENSLSSKHTEEDYFHRLRIRAKLLEKYDTGLHKITLHSFRSWFITKCNRVDADFGNALAGHRKYMKKYDRLTDKEKLDLYLKVEPTLSIFENYDDSKAKENKELRDDLEILKLKVERLSQAKEK